MLNPQYICHNLASENHTVNIRYSAAIVKKKIHLNDAYALFDMMSIQNHFSSILCSRM